MKTFLVALDNSPGAPSVLSAAASIAATAVAKLVLFRAVGLPNELPVEAYAMAPDDVVGVLRDRARTELEDRARSLPKDIAYEIRVGVGVPWQAICQAGADWAAALIIVGSHGYSGLDRFLGTTAAKVVNHADRSVMVVRRAELLGNFDLEGHGDKEGSTEPLAHGREASSSARAANG